MNEIINEFQEPIIVKKEVTKTEVTTTLQNEESKINELVNEYQEPIVVEKEVTTTLQDEQSTINELINEFEEPIIIEKEVTQTEVTTIQQHEKSLNELIDEFEEPVIVQKEVTQTEVTTFKLEPTETSTEKPKPKVRVEELSFGNNIIDDLSKLANQVNIRKVVFKTEDGNTLFEVPLSTGLVGGAVGVAILPILAIVFGSFGIFGGATLIGTNYFVARGRIVIEREE